MEPANSSNKTGAPAWIAGGCHCGRVRFEIRVRGRRALRCNCSICEKKGFINLIVAPEDFRLSSSTDALSSYRFNTEQAEHLFCKVCGIHSFSRPRSHPGSFDVNARCLDDGYAFLTIEPFDGRNWEDNVDAIR
jgi:hypothetical protein